MYFHVFKLFSNLLSTLTRLLVSSCIYVVWIVFPTLFFSRLNLSSNSIRLSLSHLLLFSVLSSTPPVLCTVFYHSYSMYCTTTGTRSDNPLSNTTGPSLGGPITPQQGQLMMQQIMADPEKKIKMQVWYWYCWYCWYW